jgi:hypothetical protein
MGLLSVVLTLLIFPVLSSLANVFFNAVNHGIGFLFDRSKHANYICVDEMVRKRG